LKKTAASRSPPAPAGPNRSAIPLYTPGILRNRLQSGLGVDRFADNVVPEQKLV